MYKLSMSQKNIYLSDRFSAGFPTNTLHTALHLLEKTDELLLKKAVDFVISNNDIFKLRLTQEDGEVFQDFSDEIKECAIDSTLYSEEELSEIFMKRKSWVLDIDKMLYDFVIYQKCDMTCVLSIVSHHIIIDGYGIGVLCDEILNVYHLILEKKVLSAQTSSFVDSLQVSFNVNEENKVFWEEYFKGYHLGDKPFPTKSDFTISSTFKGKIGKKSILDFCAIHSLTPYTVFTAALGIYLMNIYGTGETAVIIPRMNRDLHERTTIGCFVLPVPIKIKNNDNFAAICKQIAQEGKAASVHKKYDFSQLIEEFQKKFATQRPISDFTLNFQLKGVKGKIKSKMDFSACGAMRNLITLNISNYEGDSFYEIAYDYRSDIINEKFITFFHNALVGIIKQSLSGTPVKEIKIVPDAELQYLKTKFEGETVSYADDETIVSLFRKIANEKPHEPAVFTHDMEVPLTFSELDKTSGQIATALIKRGLIKGSLVGFLLDRDSDLIPTMLGILKAGCGFLPLDINYPKERINYIISDSKLSFVISVPKIANRFGIDYIDVKALISGGPDGTLNVPVDQNDLAYCIYTSGTTGKPKGVLLAHKGIVNITNPSNNPFNKAVCETATGIVAIGSICFDISLFEIFVFLLNGKFVAVAAADELANGEAIAQLIKKTGANTLHCTPSRLHSYISGNLFADVLETQIKIILSAGEVLPYHLAAQIIDYNVKIFNGYGPTEATIGATITESGDCETIGKPIANTAIYIVDAKKELLPFGITGEIAIAGDGVGLGYLGMDKLTSEKFIDINNKRAYLTGDLGYFLPDGRLKYISRNDNQIKLRGYRIELAEIEQCTQNYKGVENSAAVIKEINGENQLVLYYSGQEADSENLKMYLRKLLSHYMIPQVIIMLPSLPTNINGKTDRQALEKMPVSMERKYIPPTTEVENILCKAFQTVLTLPQVGIDDNFFEIGGTSLAAAKMMIYISIYKLDIEYSAIFEHPTPRLLAKNMGKRNIKNYLQPFVSVNEKEFEKIDRLLRQNQDGSLSKTPLGNVLLTGAKGFLGSHIVRHLLQDGSVDKIFCNVRSKESQDSAKRLKTTWFYYFSDFSDISEEQFEKKIKVINGDITDKDFFARITDNITTVINCAANVAHFAYGNTLKSINIDAVENLIEFCKMKNSALIHISTISVAGHNLKEDTKDTVYSEVDLYKGQIISNEYIYSKFVAEYLVLKAKLNGIRTKIMRVGNLQGRIEDGEFQMNLNKNAFVRNIKAFAAIGKAPTALSDSFVNVTPVDETAQAVLLLAGLPDSFTTFHVINPIPTPYNDIFSGLSAIGKEIRFIDNAEFEVLVDKLSKDDIQSGNVEGLLLEKSDIRLKEIPVNAEFTVKVLKSLGFEFKAIERDYFKKYLYRLNGLGFFD